ncbi:MAG: hypothetical protein WB676_27060 [Bryobacteraceae bacterium]
MSTIRCLILATIFLSEALALPAAAGLGSNHHRTGDVDVLGSQAGVPPKLVFASDQPIAQVASMLSQTAVMADLKELQAGIALSLPDLSAERAHIVRQLNKAGIPVTAWLTLPGKEGYYVNAGNAPEAAARFVEFERWTAEFGLHWAAVGLDIEPSLQDFSALRSSKLRLAATLFRRYFEWDRVRRAKESYVALIREIQSHGYPVETYQFPFIADERKMHSTLLERLAGIVDIRGNQEVLMLYTSFNPKIDSALIWVYGRETQAIAVGSTAGSASDHFVPLNWAAFSRDLIVAHHFSNEIGVYNLEGCVQQGFLQRLIAMDWHREVVIPAESAEKAVQFRMRIQRAIWIGSHLPYFALMIIVVSTAGVAWRRRKRRTGTRP